MFPGLNTTPNVNTNPFMIQPGSKTASMMGGNATGQGAAAPSTSPSNPVNITGSVPSNLVARANPTLAPFGGYWNATTNTPFYNTPSSLAAAINANYGAQGVPQNATAAQQQQYFNTPGSPYYTPPAVATQHPAALVSHVGASLPGGPAGGLSPDVVRNQPAPMGRGAQVPTTFNGTDVTSATLPRNDVVNAGQPAIPVGSTMSRAQGPGGPAPAGAAPPLGNPTIPTNPNNGAGPGYHVDANGNVVIGNAPAGTPASPGTNPTLTGTTTPPPASTPTSQNPQYDFGALLNYLQASGGGSPDQFLAQIAKSGGMPLDATQAWQAMVQAQQQNINQGANNIRAQYSAAGQVPTRSTDFDQSLQTYMNQAVMNQNATLGQMQIPLMQQMSSQSLGATEQLSSQAFQSLMAQMQQAYGAGQSLFQGGSSAASQLASQGAAGASQMGSQGAAGASSLLNNATSAAQQQAQLQALYTQLGMSGGQGLSAALQQQLGLGGTLGQQQYTDQQSAINNAYQEWLRQQPQYNPLLSMMFQGGNMYPPVYMPGYQPSGLSQIMQGVGSGASTGLSLAALLSLLGLSDERAKENITPLESVLPELRKLRAVRYDYLPEYGGEKNRVGVLAQDVKRLFPNLVHDVGGGMHAVDYGGIATLALRGVAELAQHFDELDQRIWSLPS